MKSISKYISIFLTLILVSLPLKAEEFKNDEPVYHIVLIWLKTYRNEMRINKIINASKELKNIPTPSIDLSSQSEAFTYSSAYQLKIDAKSPNLSQRIQT